jgi:transketolase
MAIQSNEGHIASSYSIIEILIAIYDASRVYGAFDPRDIVLSKGHASYAYYAMLFEAGLLTQAEVDNIGKQGSKLYGHVPYVHGDDRFQFGSGSLGHGLPFSIGVSFARHRNGDSRPVYCVVGDGEANEGTFWESLLLLGKFAPLNLKILVDCNGSSERGLPILQTLAGLRTAFPFIRHHSCDGHNTQVVRHAIETPKGTDLVLCFTKKGHPISFMVNNPAWHHRIPTGQEIDEIMGELS